MLSPHSERLRELATRYAPLVTDAAAVAVTGSAGRGDAEAGSDLDLWVVSEAEGVAHDVFDGVPITLMRESEARVLDLAHLSGLEVELTHVVHDPHGIFARVMARFAEHAAAIREANVEDATARLCRLLDDSLDGTAPGRLWLLRAAAHLAAALRMYEQTGLMMPKMRHLRGWLQPHVYRMLREIHGIDAVAPSVGELIQTAPRIAERMTAQLAELARVTQRMPQRGEPARVTQRPQPAAITPPFNALLKLEQGDLDDGVPLLRHCFEASFVDTVHAIAPGISMVRFLRELCDREIRAYWQTLYGVGADDVLEHTVEATRRTLDTLLGELQFGAD